MSEPFMIFESTQLELLSTLVFATAISNTTLTSSRRATAATWATVKLTPSSTTSSHSVNVFTIPLTSSKWLHCNSAAARAHSRGSEQLVGAIGSLPSTISINAREPVFAITLATVTKFNPDQYQVPELRKVTSPATGPRLSLDWSYVED